MPAKDLRIRQSVTVEKTLEEDVEDMPLEYMDVDERQLTKRQRLLVWNAVNDPQLSFSEAAKKAGYKVDIYRSNFRPMKHTLSGSDEKFMMKLVVDRGSDKVLGVHMVGSDAGEIVQGIAIAMKIGVTKDQFDATVGIHPTTAEEFVTMRETVSR